MEYSASSLIVQHLENNIKMRLKAVTRNKGIALAVPSALISSGVAPVEVGKFYEVEIKEAN